MGSSKGEEEGLAETAMGAAEEEDLSRAARGLSWSSGSTGCEAPQPIHSDGEGRGQPRTAAVQVATGGE